MLFDNPEFVPRGYDFKKEFKDDDWETENDIYKALLKNRYEVSLLGIHDDITVLTEEVKKNKPDIVFNTTDVFKNKSYFEKNIAWLLEMLEIPYTGASPASLLICNNKALTKQILSFHKIKVPNFYTFYRGHRGWLPKGLTVPLIVKPLSEEASRGIAQASMIDNEVSLIERVKFIHEKMNMDAIIEEYIQGRELHVGVLGGRKIKVLPSIEVKFTHIPKDEPRIATYKAKWDETYRRKWGIKNVFIGNLPKKRVKKVEEICKRAYRALNMQCYARFDVRITENSDVYILEVNANPCIGKYEDFGQAAEKAGIPYDKLIKRIISLASQRRR